MYTVKRAAEQVGISAATLRAWERRYGIVTPGRTEGGYRVYTEDDVDRLRAVKRLVDEGWTASLAAQETLLGPVAGGPAAGRSPYLLTEPSGDDGAPPPGAYADILVEAAGSLDAAALGRILDEMFSLGSFETVVERHLFPAMAALGEAWARGRVSVAGEHLASHAVMRRVGAAYEAAATGGRGPHVLLGMAPRRRHELGLFAFAVAARRRGLDTDYLGADLPIMDWVTAGTDPSVAAVVLALPTAADVAPTNKVIAAIWDLRPDLLVAVGGGQQQQAADGVFRLGHQIGVAAGVLAEALAGSRSSKPEGKR